MRIARTLDEVRSQFDAASSEALAGFGDGTCFIERYVEHTVTEEVTGIDIVQTQFKIAAVTPVLRLALVKYDARRPGASPCGMRRALLEMRIRGVKTNVPFLLNVLEHRTSSRAPSTASFIGDNPDLVNIGKSTWQVANYQSDQDKVYRVERNLRYLAKVAVNGHQTPRTLAKIGAVARDSRARARRRGAGGEKPLAQDPPRRRARGWPRPSAHPKLLMTDTTWRDAHQSLLATRVRTADLAAIAAPTQDALGDAAFSLEMWGGATFDMLLRGANAVGYTSYPDDVVYQFCETAKEKARRLRVFDSLNGVENLELGVKAAKAAGGFVEAAICYTGDVANEAPDNKYSLSYYRDLAKRPVSRRHRRGDGHEPRQRRLLEDLVLLGHGPRDALRAFESGQLATASGVKVHEIPGGQYTNLLFQSRQLGLDGRFDDVKAKYAMANRILGDIPKVTPSSKVVGDLAFMVAQNLMEADGRPGASLGAYDFEEAREMLKEKYADATKQITFEDVLAAVPAVFSDYMDHRLVYGDVDHLPTHVFLRPMKVNDEVSFDDARGRKYFIKLATRAADQVGAPMPGVVVAVNVKEGDVVKKGETLFVLSAMKMESTIVAPQDGTVDSILINSGDS
ncbi:pyruvate carboxylase [Aureococcus anophagefferens]|nr:pyruvate carboxylase [Aureococcus anophagefferens]